MGFEKSQGRIQINAAKLQENELFKKLVNIVYYKQNVMWMYIEMYSYFESWIHFTIGFILTCVHMQ